LKDPDGTVEIGWTVYGLEGAADGSVTASDTRRFRMEWVERTADPIAPPTHKGFGRMVIEHTVETTLGGTVTLEFPPEGMRWRIDAPATCLAPSVPANPA
jgi:two-component sensor histidine kinase